MICLLGLLPIGSAVWNSLPEDNKKSVLVWLFSRARTEVSGCFGIDQQSPNPAMLKGTTLKLAIIESGNIAYVRTIATAFRQAIETCAQSSNFRVLFEEAIGPLVPASKKTQIEWDDKIGFVQKRMTPNYWITIGTQASVNLKRVLGEGVMKASIVFAGVTDPVCSRLVLAETKRGDGINLGGVRYGGDPADYVGKIAEFFPKRNIVYVYHKNHLQDACFAKDLERNPLVIDKTLSFLPLDHLPSLADLLDREAVYFSWYTFEEMFEDNRGTDILSKRIVIATTRNNVEGDDLAPIGVAGNDVEIGQRAAAVLLRDLYSVKPLSRQDVEKPSYQVLVNCRTAKRRGLSFPPHMVVGATQLNCSG